MLKKTLIAASAITSGLLLTSCTGFAVRALTDITYLHEAAGDYVREIHGVRQFIRQECKASLVREIDTLKQNGDEKALRELLAKNYPGLVTVDIVSQARENPEGILSKAPGCN